MFTYNAPVRRLTLIAAVALMLSYAQIGRAAAITSDQTALVSLADAAVTGQPGSNQSYVLDMSIDGTWALVGWTDKSNSGGVLLASKSSGTWKTVVNGGGQPSANDLQTAGVDATTASFLENNLRPLPPVGGPSNNASGTSSHILYTERCATDTTPPRFYSCQYADPSNSTSYNTSSIQPLNAGSAVVADISVTAGTATVSLYGPGNTLLQQVTLSAGQSGGVGYFDPTAAAGVYSVAVSGTAPGSLDPGGSLISQQTYVDATWTGTLSW